MKILVCGGRDYNDYQYFSGYMDSLFRKEIENKDVTIICGGATGADSLAERWAKSKGLPYRIFYADWNKHGKAAGPIRNKQMLDEGKPDIVVAFPGGRGTQNMMKLAREANVEVLEVLTR